MRTRTRRPTPEFLEFRALLSVVGTTATNLVAPAGPTGVAPAAETSGPTSDHEEYARHATSAESDSASRSGSESDSTTSRSASTDGSESESDSRSSPSGTSTTPGQVADSSDDSSEDLGTSSGGGTTPVGSVPTGGGSDDGSDDSGDDSGENAAPPPTSTPPSSGSTGSTGDGSSDDGNPGAPVGGTGTSPSGPVGGTAESGPTGPPIPPVSTPVVTQPVAQSGHGSSSSDTVSPTSPGTEPASVKQTSHSSPSGTEAATAVSSEETHGAGGAVVPVGIGGGSSADGRGAATSGDDATAAPLSGLAARGAASQAGAVGNPAGSLPGDALPPSDDDGASPAGNGAGNSDGGSGSQRLPGAETSAQTETLQSRAADLIASCSPFDRRAVEMAIDQFLNQLGEIEVAFAQTGSSAALIPSVIATAVILTASETVRRRLSRAGDESGDGERRVVFPALPGRNQRWALEEL